MNFEKTIIILALIISLTVFIFRENIIEEARLFRQLEANESIENLPALYLYPFTQQERSEALKEHLEKMSALQERISRSLFTKHLVDLRDHIIKVQKEILDDSIEAHFGEDALSFNTANFNIVIANPLFSKEQVLKLGSLIDEMFPEEETNNIIHALDLENDRIVLNIYLYEGVPLAEKHLYREFVNRLSRDIFHNEPVSLHVTTPNSEKKKVFKSKPSSSSLSLVNTL